MQQFRILPRAMESLSEKTSFSTSQPIKIKQEKEEEQQMHHLSRSISAPVQTETELIQSLLDYVQEQKAPREIHSANDCLPQQPIKRKRVNHNNLIDYSMSRAEWFHCLELFLLQQQPQQTRDIFDTHVCSNSCDFFIYKTFLTICKSTGNIHECFDKCTERIETRENCVCPITSIAFASPISLRINGGNDNDSEFAFQNKMERSLKSTNNKTLAQQQRDHIIRSAIKELEIEHPSKKLTTEERKEVRAQFGYQRKELKHDPFTLSVEAVRIIRKVLLLNQNEIKLNIGQIADWIVSWWTMMQLNLVKDNTEKSEYKFIHHVLACLYQMKQEGGFTHRGKNIIPFNLVIAENIIQQKQLKEVFSRTKNPGTKREKGVINSAQITKAGKILRTHLVG